MVTLMPSGATSLCRTSEKPSTPNFAVWYAARPGVPPTRPPTEENCRKCPERCRRNTGSAAWVTRTTPKRLVSSCARNDSSVVCSTGALSACPALLTTTSSRPNVSSAAWTAASTAAPSVTSRATVHTRLPKRSARPASCRGSRAVATTVSPASRTAVLMARPKPRLLPVTSQVLVMVSSSRGDSGSRDGRGDGGELGVEVGSLDAGLGGVRHQEGQHGGDHRQAGQGPEGGGEAGLRGQPVGTGRRGDDAADHRGAQRPADGPDV